MQQEANFTEDLEIPSSIRDGRQSAVAAPLYTDEGRPWTSQPPDEYITTALYNSRFHRSAVTFTVYLPRYMCTMVLTTHTCRPVQQALAAAQAPLFDFLAPSLIYSSPVRSARCMSASRRALSGTTVSQSDNVSPNDYPSTSGPARIPKSASPAATKPAPVSKPLTQAQRDFLTSAVRTFQYPPKTQKY